MNRIRIWDKSGKELHLSEYGLQGLRLIVPSPSYEVTNESIPGRNGTVNLGKDLSPRVLSAEFLFEAQDYEQSLSLRDKLYNLFSDKFYIGEVKQPDKRWFVESEPWTPDRINSTTSTFTIPLYAEKGVAESVKNTFNPTMITAQLSGSEAIAYKHSTTTFKIFNGGDVAIDPRYLPLKITYSGASTNLKIKNVTTNEEWAYTGTSSSGNNIILDGIRSTKNGLTIFRDTNKKLISLVPGWNSFQLTGTSGTFEISFDFKFYTL